MSPALDGARAVADAVLYEGFLLYPYTASALKNRMRWQFGVLMPQGYADRSEPNTMSTQLLARRVEGDASLDVIARFLGGSDDPQEREVSLTFALAQGVSEREFSFGALCGVLRVTVEPDGEYFRVDAQVENRSVVGPDADRDEALRHALIGAHALFFAQGARFLSLLDPPEGAADAAARCNNDRVFPVLVGDDDDGGHSAAMALASPIVLYDFPKIAPQSAGQTFDGTEVDELLMLSVAALTEDEKREARATHPRARAIVDRAEAFDAATQSKLHGRVTIGARVRVHPKRRADAFDIFAEGRVARVRGVHDDVDGRSYVSVVFEDDPAADLHDWYGRGFFYEDDEFELLEAGSEVILRQAQDDAR